MSAVLPAIKLRTMADFRRALAMPGVQLVRLDTPVPNRRTVAVLQSDAVAFRIEGCGDAPSWLWFGPAHDWSFCLRAHLAAMAEAERELFCRQCGRGMFITDNGVSHHVGSSLLCANKIER